MFLFLFGKLMSFLDNTIFFFTLKLLTFTAECFFGDNFLGEFLALPITVELGLNLKIIELGLLV